MADKIRLQKAIADAGICSRRAAEELIRLKKVKVNNFIASIGDKVNVEFDEIEVDEKKIKKENKVYFLLNKPKGVISTSIDERGRSSVIDLIKTEKRIVPVGRLDKDTTGLLILTNDGDLVNKLTHPKFEHKKEYEALVQVPHDWVSLRLQDAIKKLERGVRIANDFRTSPAKVKILNQVSNDRYYLSIIIYEGHKHQVRQMLDAVGISTVELKRVATGSVRLGEIKEGEYRELSKGEIQELKK